jgi:hypothetical protein
MGDPLYLVGVFIGGERGGVGGLCRAFYTKTPLYVYTTNKCNLEDWQTKTLEGLLNTQVRLLMEWDAIYFTFLLCSPVCHPPSPGSRSLPSPSFKLTRKGTCFKKYYVVAPICKEFVPKGFLRAAFRIRKTSDPPGLSRS